MPMIEEGMKQARYLEARLGPRQGVCSGVLRIIVR